MIRVRNRYLLAADILAVVGAAWVAFAFRFGWLFLAEREEFARFVVAAVVIKVAVYLGFGVYRQYWRYAGAPELLSLVFANTLASFLLSLAILAGREWHLITGVSRLVMPLDWVFATALTVGGRVAIRLMGEAQTRAGRRQSQSWRNVLIVGAGDAGSLVAREMQRNPQLGLRAVGFLDDDTAKVGKRIYGVPVLGGLSHLADVAPTHRVDEVVIAIPKAPGSTVRAVVDACRDAGVASRVIPGIFELLEGQLTVSRLREVEIGDLLRRPQVTARASAPLTYLRGACVLVTGAGGSIGSELCRQIAGSEPATLVLLGHGENSIFAITEELRHRHPQLDLRPAICDVRDRHRLFQVFHDVRPQVVFHAAAHKHVPLMEANAPEAISNNVIGTRNTVDAATDAGVERFVMVSTDKAASSSSVMGASKRVAEMIVQRAADARQIPFVVVRFGNVLGSRGSVVPTFAAQIRRGGPVTVTHPEVRRYFMTIPEAVHLILQAAELGKGGELFVLEMGEPVFLRDMAADMIRLSGLTEQEVPIVFTGLRPGEKLTEVLWEEDASVQPTESPDIRMVREALALDTDVLDRRVHALELAASRNDRAAIVGILSDMLPNARLTHGERAVPATPQEVAQARHLGMMEGA